MSNTIDDDVMARVMQEVQNGWNGTHGKLAERVGISSKELLPYMKVLLDHGWVKE